MKKTLLTCTIFLFVVSLTSVAAVVQAGPNRGRLITQIVPHAEFHVTAERHVQITFVDESGQPVAPADQVVKVTTGKRSAPLTLTFSRDDRVLLSDQPIPDGNGFPTVVQIKTDPAAPTVVERFYLNTHVCSGCNNPEYACTCGH